LHFRDKTEPAPNVPDVYERKNKMENKKTIIAIIIITILIIALIVISYFYNDFNTKQMALLTDEANKILETDLLEYNVDFDIKSEKNYGEVEEQIKEYISRLKNIYLEMEELVSGMNPNSIFSAENMPDKKLDEIDNIIKEYKEKSQNLIAEYEELTSEEKIMENINNSNISTRKEYYVSLYKEVMLSEAMQNQYMDLDEEIKNEKARLYEKLNKIDKMKTFFEENDDSWTIKDGQVQFTNVNRIIEYYNLFNQVID